MCVEELRALQEIPVRKFYMANNTIEGYCIRVEDAIAITIFDLNAYTKFKKYYHKTIILAMYLYIDSVREII